MQQFVKIIKKKTKFGEIIFRNDINTLFINIKITIKEIL